MDAENRKLVLMIYTKFRIIFGDKFMHTLENKEMIKLWADEWESAILGISAENVSKAIDHCKLNLEWPPSIAEFRRFCESSTGLPSKEEVYRAIYKRDFYHPIIKEIYDTIGSWSFTHDTEKESKSKVYSLYKEITEKNKRRMIDESKALSNQRTGKIAHASEFH